MTDIKLGQLKQTDFNTGILTTKYKQNYKEFILQEMFGSCLKIIRPSGFMYAGFDGTPIYQSGEVETIQEGEAFFINAEMVPRGDRFIVDFCVEKDIALRLGFRLSTGSLRRNSRVSHKWLQQENSLVNPLPIVHGKTFELEVFFSPEYIYIAIDGIHLAKYSHLLPFSGIRCTEIRGDVMNIVVERIGSGVYPSVCRSLPEIEKRNLSVRTDEAAAVEVSEATVESVAVAGSSPEKAFLNLPYYAKFSLEDFKQDDRIAIEGYVAREPVSFKVVLQTDQQIWPQPDIAVQVEFRFCEENADESDGPVVVVNSFADGNWADGIKEELEPTLRSMLGFFSLTITRGETAFEVHFCNKHICSYPYLQVPLTANTCLIDGDLKLIGARLEVH